MRANIEAYAPVAEFSVDRGYLSCDWIVDLENADIPVYSKPWNPSNKGLFRKSDFYIDVEAGEVTCPGGEIAPFPTRRGKDGKRQVYCPDLRHLSHPFKLHQSQAWPLPSHPRE